ncbi:MAG: hypothetical protein V1776_02035 [Candidatus Diapherotrites archaeon]
MRQWNAILVGSALLLLMGVVYADVSLVDPVVAKARPNGIIDAGSISPGDTAELIFSRISGYGKTAFWNQAILTLNGNGTGIRTTNSKEGTDSLITSIRTTTAKQEGTYTFNVTLKGDGETLLDEHVSLTLNIQKGLMKASLSAESVEGRVNEPLLYYVLLVNDSSATVPVFIEPMLPQSWTEGKTITLKPHSFESIPLIITPRFAGPKGFEINVIRADNGITIRKLDATLVANPTLKDRYSAGLYGFPFFTISLVSHYLANAFFSFLL